MAPPRTIPLPPKWALLLLGMIWTAAVAWGFHLALVYQATAGEPALSDGAWPADAPITRDVEHPTLVLCVHPHCPCSRATLEELDRLLARCRGELRVCALFYADPALGADWVKSDLWSHAAAIPGVEVSADPLGRTAALFGARTSGQAFLFAPDGELVFEGGITSARGHEGENAGAAAVAEYVNAGTLRVAHAPVFGCALAHEGGTP